MSIISTARHINDVRVPYSKGLPRPLRQGRWSPYGGGWFLLGLIIMILLLSPTLGQESVVFSYEDIRRRGAEAPVIITSSDFTVTDYSEECSGHYQSYAYATETKYPRLCAMGSFSPNGTCSNWIACKEIFMQQAIKSPAFIGYHQIGAYPPSSSKDYTTIETTYVETNSTKKHVVELLRCKMFNQGRLGTGSTSYKGQPRQGYCYLHDTCSDIPSCLDSMAGLLATMYWDHVTANMIIGLRLIT